MIGIKFNGYNFTFTDGMLVEEIPEVFDLPKRDVNSKRVVTANKSVLVNTGWVDKAFTIRGVIRRPTRDLLQTSIDTIKRVFAAEEGVLELSTGATGRRYIATMSDFTTPQQMGGFAKFSVNVLCSYPFGESLAPLSTSYDDITERSKDFEINIQGSYDAAPVFVFTYSDVVDGANAQVKLKNNDEGSEISITGNFASGDVIKFDMKAMEVTVNGEVTPYEGVFFTFQPDVSSWGFEDTLTSASLDIKLDYFPRWL